MLFFASLALAFALSLLNPSETQTATLHPVPPQIWAVIWLVEAVMCVMGAVAHRFDRIAFAVAGGVVFAWSVAYLLAWVVGTAPRGWLGAVIYMELAVLIATVGTWPEVIVSSSVLVTDDYPYAVITVDQEGRIVGWRGAAPRLFGWTAEQVDGRPVDLIVPERYRESHTNAFAQAHRSPGLLREGRAIEVFGLRSDGTEFPVSVFLTAHKTGAGGTLLYSGVISRRTP